MVEPVGQIAISRYRSPISSELVLSFLAPIASISIAAYLPVYSI